MSTISEPELDAGQPQSVYSAARQSPEFRELRRSFRRFVFPLTAFFLAWYFLYVILADFFPSFMAHRLFGTVTVGLVMGLLQFVTTFAITIAYVRWADRHYDAQAEAIRAQWQGDL